ncbi:hypothetical protein [Mitsuokella multacida]|uniref:Uncharacterized protein n=1 Tax=Mitsuokella multacida TaxID=52226 RepID=A0A414NZG3_9FIRM|nr:hypothetical protein [Mitsuokella multacida]RHF53336.1 hypothetical protein DW674_00270 [Mitsuokella multacida]
MREDGKWRFASNNKGIVDGFNDPGIETFSANSIASMVREVIQNSVDQQVDDSRPVVVDFDFFQVTQDEIPGGRQLENIFDRCITASKGDPVATGFFQQAQKLMKGKIDVLRISDHNTTGLVGAETDDTKTPWHQLVKGRGSSNKNINSGGSFGIGKAAPLACSYFHTIFYASKVDAIDSYVGVSRLLSFKEKESGFFGKEYTTTGTGFYSSSDNMNAILKPFAMGHFKRRDNGTDIYILALEKDKDLYGTIRLAVLENFFVSIEFQKLIVHVGQDTINRNSLAQYIAQLDDKKYAALKDYYNLLIHRHDDPEENRVISLDADEYGKKYGIKDGECTLLLHQGEELNQRVLMTRKTGMTLFPQSRLGNSISYTGILLIQGDTMNQIFKTMEMPAHDKWEPGRCKVNKTFYENAYTDLKQYLRKKIIENFGAPQQDIEAAYGMDEFFADAAGDGALNVELKERKPKAKMIKRKARRRRTDREIKVKEPPEEGGLDDNPRTDDKKDDPKKDGRTTKDPADPAKKKYNFKFRAVKKRLVANNMMNGEFTLAFTIPISKSRIRLEVVGLAERGNYKIPVHNVRIDGNDSAVEVEKNSITFGPAKKGQTIAAHFSTGFQGPMMMEVNYYEAK